VIKHVYKNGKRIGTITFPVADADPRGDENPPEIWDRLDLPATNEFRDGDDGALDREAAEKEIGVDVLEDEEMILRNYLIDKNPL